MSVQQLLCNIQFKGNKTPQCYLGPLVLEKEENAKTTLQGNQATPIEVCFRHSTRAHACHTMPMHGRGGGDPGRETSTEKGQSQEVTVIFSPASAEAAKPPFLLVLF